MSHRHNPRALLTSAMRGVLDRMARAGAVPMHLLKPAQARAFYEMGAGVLEIPSPNLVRVENLAIPARDGHTLPARLFAPSHDALPVLMYFHGGGFTIGSVASHDTLCRELAHLAHCAVISVDYRLAPEFKFPTASNDAWDAVQWLAAQGKTLGLDTQRLAVGGDSAGGTLAARAPLCVLRAATGPATALLPRLCRASGHAVAQSLCAWLCAGRAPHHLVF